MVTNYVAITDSSVWLIEANDEGTSGHVIDRATFGSPFIEDGRRFAGPIIAGPDGIGLKPGGRIVFRNAHEDSYGDTDRVVTSGIINRVVRHGDEPAPAVWGEVEGVQTMTLQPSWTWLMPFIDGGADVRAEARRAFDLADLLVTLSDMGRVTQADLQAARERRVRT